MIWLLGIGRMLSRALSAAWEFIRTNPALCAVIALGVLSAVLWQRGDRYRDKLLAIQSAQVKATEDQVAVNKAPAVISRTISEKSNVDSQAFYEEGRRAGIAYSASHRVRLTCPVGNPDLRGPDSPASVDDSASSNAELVGLTEADFNICTANSTRLAQVHADVSALIEAGVAVPVN